MLDKFNKILTREAAISPTKLSQRLALGGNGGGSLEGWAGRVLFPTLEGIDNDDVEVLVQRGGAEPPPPPLKGCAGDVAGEFPTEGTPPGGMGNGKLGPIMIGANTLKSELDCPPGRWGGVCGAERGCGVFGVSSPSS